MCAVSKYHRPGRSCQLGRRAWAVLFILYIIVVVVVEFHLDTTNTLSAFSCLTRRACVAVRTGSSVMLVHCQRTYQAIGMAEICWNDEVYNTNGTCRRPYQPECPAQIV